MEPLSCRVIRGDGTYEGKQGLSYFLGVSAGNAGAQHLCLHLLVIPPSGRARAHLHENHESAIFLVQGKWTCSGGIRSRSTSGCMMGISCTSRPASRTCR